MESDATMVELPADALAVLAHRCRRAGPDGRRALQESGRHIGREVHRRVEAEAPAGNTPLPDFWAVVAETLEDMGLGRPVYEVVDSGLASLTIEDPPAAKPVAKGGADDVPSDAEFGSPVCVLLEGTFEALLEATAGTAVAVREVACGVGPEGSRCRFLVGAGSRVDQAERGAEAETRWIESASPG